MIRTYLAASILLLLFAIILHSQAAPVPVHADDPTTRCPDFNNDSIVSIADIGLVTRQFGTTESSADWDPSFDLDSNGFVGIVEISLPVARFGTECLDIGDSIPFDTILQESWGFSGTQLQGLHTASDQDEWQALWEEVTPETEPLPSVNFEEEMVVGIFGICVTGGHILAIDAIIASEKEWVIQAARFGHGDAQVITFPHHIVRVQRTDLPIRLSLKEGTPDCEL